MTKAFLIDYTLIKDKMKKVIFHDYMKDKPLLVEKYLNVSLIDDKYSAHQSLIENDPIVMNDIVKLANSPKYRTQVLGNFIDNFSLIDKIGLPTREADMYVEDVKGNFTYIWLEERLQLYRMDSRYYASNLIYDEKYNSLLYTNDKAPSRIDIYKMPWKEDDTRDKYSLESLVAMEFRSYLAEKELLK